MKQTALTLTVATAIATAIIVSNGSTTVMSVSDIQTQEASYFQSTGNYFQVLQDGTSPQGVSFAKKFPSGLRVDVYNSPTGKGYQIISISGGNINTIGAGPEAIDRTYQDLVPVSATSS